MIANRAARLAQRNHLGVGAGIVIGAIAIESAADNFFVANHDRAHRHLARGFCLRCQAQRFFHPGSVGHCHPV